MTTPPKGQQRPHRVGRGAGRKVQTALGPGVDVVVSQHHDEHAHEHQDADQRDAIEHVEALKAPHDADPGDDRHDCGGQHPFPDGGAVTEEVEHVLGQDAQVERHRDDVGDDDHRVGEPVQPVGAAVKLARGGTRLHHPHAVADRGSCHPGQGADARSPDHGEGTQGALQHGDDDQES